MPFLLYTVSVQPWEIFSRINNQHGRSYSNRTSFYVLVSYKSVIEEHRTRMSMIRFSLIFVEQRSINSLCYSDMIKNRTKVNMSWDGRRKACFFKVGSTSAQLTGNCWQSGLGAPLPIIHIRLPSHPSILLCTYAGNRGILPTSSDPTSASHMLQKHLDVTESLAKK